MRRLATVTLAAAIAAVLASSAFAQAPKLDAAALMKLVPNLAGIGIGAAPDYSGSDDYTWVAAPAAQYKFGETNRSISLWGPFGSANLIDSPKWSAGPTLSLRFGRQDVEDEVVKRMSEVDHTGEAGAYVAYMHINTEGIPWIARVATGVQWDVRDVYDGAYAWASGQFFVPLREDIFVGLGGGVGGGSTSFVNAYYAVTPQDALASGLPSFRGSSGVTNYYVWPAIIWRFHPNWLAGVGGMYQRLIGDAADSPIVRDRGSASQWFGGAGLAYLFW